RFQLQYSAGSTNSIGQARSRLMMTSAMMTTAIILLWLAGWSPQVYGQDKTRSVPQTVSAEASPLRQTFTHEGVSVEFSIDPFVSTKGKGTELLADSEVTVRFKVVDANGGKALSNLRPAAWI